MIPALYTSEAGVSSEPRACSGDMYAGVPSTWPSSVPSVWSPLSTREIPKSVTLIAASLANIRLSGFTSRWRTPLPCACCSAAQQASATAQAVGGVRPAVVKRSQTVPPGSCSITMRQRPSRST